MALFPRVAVIEELVEQLAVDRDLDVGNHMPAILLGHSLDLIGEPGVRGDNLVVDMNKRIKRSRPDRVAVGAIDLGLLALAEVAVGRRAAGGILPCLPSPRPWPSRWLEILDSGPVSVTGDLGGLVRFP